MCIEKISQTEQTKAYITLFHQNSSSLCGKHLLLSRVLGTLVLSVPPLPTRQKSVNADLSQIVLMRRDTLIPA